MGKRSTTAGYWRARGATNSSSGKLTGPTPGVLPITLAVPVDPTATAGTGTGKYLPLGAIVLGIDVVSGHTGGTAPLLDIGLGADVDALLDGAAADADLSINVATATTPGVSFGVALTADAEVVAGTGGGVVGTGTSIAYITYTMDDDGAVND